jgi:hypothetical protein
VRGCTSCVGSIAAAMACARTRGAAREGLEVVDRFRQQMHCAGAGRGGRQLAGSPATKFRRSASHGSRGDGCQLPRLVSGAGELGRAPTSGPNDLRALRGDTIRRWRRSRPIRLRSLAIYSTHFVSLEGACSPHSWLPSPHLGCHLIFPKPGRHPTAQAPISTQCLHSRARCPC